jgi:16S rRNA (cytosine967-C5)-methyltransferase
LTEQTEAGGIAPRLGAFQILSRIHDGQLFEVARDRELNNLQGKDKGLAHQLAAGVLRNRTKLDLAISAKLTHPWNKVQENLRNVLRLGAYQLIYLDRVPKYAAVNTAVEICKKTVGPRQAPLVNAVLRKLGPDSVAPLECKTPEELADEYSHPRWLVIKWVKKFGFERTRSLLGRNNTVPPITLRPIRVTLDQLKESLTSDGLSFRESAFGIGVSIVHATVDQLPGYSDGDFIVQDPAQSMAIDFANLPTNGLIWDPCAAPGGKSTVVSSVSDNVIASDFTEHRVRLLMENLERAQITIPVLRTDAVKPPFRDQSLDAVVLDAPCSSTGTFRKHPDARWRITKRTIRTAAKTQTALLDSVAKLVKPGGILVYLTCSLEQEENQDVVNWFLNSHPEFERTEEDLSIFPDDYGTDGAYGARLARKHEG